MKMIGNEDGGVASYERQRRERRRDCYTFVLRGKNKGKVL